MRPLIVLLVGTPVVWASCGPPESSSLAANAPDAEQLLEQGHFTRALGVLPANPADARSLWLLSRAEAGLGHLDRSLQWAEKAVALEPAVAAYHVQLAAACGRLAGKASMLKQLTFAHRAKKELETALHLEPDNIDALYGSMLFYYAAPSFLGGDKLKAQQSADRMTARSPERGYLAQAKVAKDRKDDGAEEAFYRKSVSADPRFYDAHAELAQFLLSRDAIAAEREACWAIVIDASRADAWRVLVAAQARQQCWNELFESLERASELVPDDSSPKFAAGEALAEMGRHYLWAADWLRQYLGGAHDDDGALVARAHLYLAQSLDHLQQTAEAAGEYQAALALDPSLKGRLPPRITSN